MKAYFFNLLFVINLTNSLLCDKIIFDSNNEYDLIDKIKLNFDDLKKELRCIELLIRLGNYRAAESFMDLLKESKVDFFPALRNSIKRVKETLEKFGNEFKYKDEEFLIVSPAIQWAQSMDNIFIQIKLSHRHDAPGCLELIEENIALAPTHLSFRASCNLSDHPMKFFLDLHLNDIVEEVGSSSEKSSVGRINITLKKKISKYWKSLVRDGLSPPPNTKVWYEMRNKYLEELEYHIEQEEEEEERREEEERNALRKKKKQTSQEEKSDNKQSNENPEKVNVDSTTTDNNELSSEVKKEDL